MPNPTTVSGEVERLNPYARLWFDYGAGAAVAQVLIETGKLPFEPTEDWLKSRFEITPETADEFEADHAKALQALRVEPPSDVEQGDAPDTITILKRQIAERDEVLREARILLFDSLYHLRLDDGAAIYDRKAKALRAKLSALIGNEGVSPQPI